MNTLLKLQTYMGGRKALLPGSLALSAMSSLMGHAAVYFYLVNCRRAVQIQGRCVPGTDQHLCLVCHGNGRGVVSFFIFWPSRSRHLAAFRAETNMRRQAMQKIVQLPLGFFDAGHQRTYPKNY